MRNFVAIDFETANSQRVSACAVGYARVVNGAIVESNSHLIKPVGGHHSFQSRIHGIKEEHTTNKPDFGELFPDIRKFFDGILVAHSLFDKQVLTALTHHYELDLEFQYFDTCSLAKSLLPNLKNHKLDTLAIHFALPAFTHHDAKADAEACAAICVRLHESLVNNKSAHPVSSEIHEFRGLINGILADEVINYKEAYGLLYWLRDHEQIKSRYKPLYESIQRALEDEKLDYLEECDLQKILKSAISDSI
jgi:DNA polymerase III subunit epsilon